jgi:hypothetical protein
MQTSEPSAHVCLFPHSGVPELTHRTSPRPEYGAAPPLPGNRPSTRRLAVPASSRTWWMFSRLAPASVRVLLLHYVYTVWSSYFCTTFTLSGRLACAPHVPGLAVVRANVLLAHLKIEVPRGGDGHGRLLVCSPALRPSTSTPAARQMTLVVGGYRYGAGKGRAAASRALQ